MFRKTTAFLTAFLGVALMAAQPSDDLLSRLDRTIDGKEAFARAKLSGIEIYKQQAARVSGEELFGMYSLIYDEYANYDLDSAMVYARRLASLSQSLGHEANREESLLKLADVYITAGMYAEAQEIADKVTVRTPRYYHVRHYLYSSMLLNSPFLGMKDQYAALKESYRDSLIRILPENDIVYVYSLSEKLNDEGRYMDALGVLKEKYEDPATDDRMKAILDYSLAVSYKGLHNREMAKYHFARSAINDLSIPVKEYKSLQELAYMLYEDGDVSRAFRYISCAMEDVLASNSQVRMAEFVPFLTVISSAYESRLSSTNRKLRLSIIGLGVVLLLLVAAGAWSLRQGRRLRRMHRESELSNASLMQANASLTELKDRLQEAGAIKEEYLYMYMEQASGYMDRLESWRRKLVKTLRQGGEQAIKAELEEPFDTDGEVKEFYNNFDVTFLHLFPTFVEDVNALLRPEAALTPKPGRLMNTELRVMALIRLGVTDSVKIAHFLRCSLSTVYNYRTKLRGAALSPGHDFEEAVARIGIL